MRCEPVSFVDFLGSLFFRDSELEGSLSKLLGMEVLFFCI